MSGSAQKAVETPVYVRIMSAMPTKRGKIVITVGSNVLDHELHTAEALANDGCAVEFVQKSETDFEKTAILIDGLFWEMKAPKSGKLRMVEQNLRRSLR